MLCKTQFPNFQRHFQVPRDFSARVRFKHHGPMAQKNNLKPCYVVLFRLFVCLFVCFVCLFVCLFGWLVGWFGWLVCLGDWFSELVS